MAETVYLLCAITSLVCAFLLFRGWRRTSARLLFWTSICFAGLALNNVLLFVDLIMVPTIDLALWRQAVSLAAMATLVFGLIWER